MEGTPREAKRSLEEFSFGLPPAKELFFEPSISKSPEIQVGDLGLPPSFFQEESYFSQALIERNLLMRSRCKYDLTPLYHARFPDKILNGDESERMTCLIETMGSTLQGTENANFRIRNWLIRNTLIGKPSVEGFVMGTKINRSDNRTKIVIKVPRRDSDVHLIHEACVGFYCLNHIRSFGIPNFAYCYGAFFCDSPVINKSLRPAYSIFHAQPEKIITWCSSSKDPITHLVEEGIEGDTLSDVIPTLKVKEYLLILLQILNALNMAYQKYGFTHYDLHDKNVLVRIMDTQYAVPFYFQGDTGGSWTRREVEPHLSGFIISHYVPVIIDYGASRFILRDGDREVSLGRYNIIETAQIDPHSSFQIHDVYKLLCFNARAAQGTNRVLFLVIDSLFRFFEEGPIGKRLETHDAYPANRAKHGHRTLEQFIVYLIEYVTTHHIRFGFDRPPELIRPQLAPYSTVIAEDGSNLLLDFYEMVSTPLTLEEYCDAMGIINRLPNKEFFERQLETVDVIKIYTDMAPRFENYFRLIAKTREDITRLNITEIENIRDIINEERALAYYNTTRKMAVLKDLIFTIRKTTIMAQCSFAYRKITTYDEELAGYLRRLPMEYYNQILYHLHYIKNMTPEPSVWREFFIPDRVIEALTIGHANLRGL